MRKNKKGIFILCTAFAMALASTVSGYADYQQSGTYDIRLFGSTECKKSGQTICVDVWTNGMGVDELRKAKNRDEYTNIIVFRDETVSADNGVYDIKVSLDGHKSGIYNVFIGCACGEEIKHETLLFSNPEETKAVAELLNKTVSDGIVGGLTKVQISEKVLDICTEHNYSLGIDDNYPIDSYASQIITQEIMNKPLDPSNKSLVVNLCGRAAIISAVHSGKLSNLFDVAALLKLDESRISDFYNAEYVDNSFGTYMTKKLKEKDFSTVSDFFDGLYEQFVLSTVKKSDGYKNIQNAVNEFSVEIFGKARSITKEEALKVQNKELSSYKEIADIINQKSSSDSSGSSSRNSGGTGGKIGDYTFSDSYVSEDVPEKISKNIFDDIEDVSWAIEAITELAQKGILNGKVERLFYPNDNITREEFVKITALTFFDDNEFEKRHFDDVSDSEWYSEYVYRAFSAGIINGVSENVFGTGMNITREDMAVIAYRTALNIGKLEEYTISSEFVFDDDKNISDYAKTAIYALYNAGVINGVGDNEFAPKEALTRAQAAKIIYEIYDLK